MIRGWTKTGYCKLRKTFDDQGKLLKEEYLDGDDKPTVNRSAIAGKIYEYDDRGRLIRETTIGKDGKPYSGRAKHAIVEYTYDATGKKQATKYSSSGVKVG